MPIRKALLVAIVGDSQTPGQALLTPHRDARAWRDALIRKFSCIVPVFAECLRSQSHAWCWTRASRAV